VVLVLLRACIHTPLLVANTKEMRKALKTKVYKGLVSGKISYGTNKCIKVNW
jgi:hypothetical protein